MRHQQNIVLLATLLLFAFGTVKHAQAATFTFDPSSVNIATDQEFTVIITLDSQNEKLVGAQAAVVFDPQIISVRNVKSSNFFQKSFTNVSGKNTLLLGSAVASLSNEKSGSGPFFSLTLAGKKEGSTSLSFICVQGKVDETSIFTNSASGFDDVAKCDSLPRMQLTFSKTASPGTETNTPTPTTGIAGETTPSPTPSGNNITPTKTPTPSSTEPTVTSMPTLTSTPTISPSITPTPTISSGIGGTNQKTPTPAQLPTSGSVGPTIMTISFGFALAVLALLI